METNVLKCLSLTFLTAVRAMHSFASVLGTPTVAKTNVYNLRHLSFLHGYNWALLGSSREAVQINILVITLHQQNKLQPLKLTLRYATLK